MNRRQARSIRQGVQRALSTHQRIYDAAKHKVGHADGNLRGQSYVV